MTPTPQKVDIVPRTGSGTRSESTATAGASIMFRPTIEMQYENARITGLANIPTPNKPKPPTIPPSTIHGVRRPKRERVRSERFPNTRFETRETIAVTALMVPSIASGLSTPMSFNRCGRSTDATVAKPIAHRSEMQKKPIPNRMRTLRFNVRPVSGEAVDSNAGAPAFSTSSKEGSDTVMSLTSLSKTWPPLWVTYLLTV